jgi:uncharacterized protein YbjT (DUF2867 family)
MNAKKKILLTGATGYVGSMLYEKLKSQKLEIALAVRTPKNFSSKLNKSTNIIKADFTKDRSIKKVEKELFQGVDTAYYLIHSMTDTASKSFDQIESECAKNFISYCKKYKVKKVVYLGGLGDDTDKKSSAILSKHLRSRQNVGKILASTSIPCIEFRASIVIGNGSFSYEMIRSLMHLVPFLPWTQWANAKSQPIYIDDLLNYLSKAKSLVFKKSEVFEIGGQVVKYGDLLKIYAKVNQLNRPKVIIPYITPSMAGIVFELLAPEFKQMGPILLESIIHDTVVTNDRADKRFKIETIKVLEAFKECKKQRSQEDQVPSLAKALLNVRVENIRFKFPNNEDLVNRYHQLIKTAKNPEAVAVEFFEDVIKVYKKEQVNKWFKDYPGLFSGITSKYKENVPSMAQNIIDKLRVKRR